MIEKIVYDYLTARLDVPVFLDMPGNPPEKCVFVDKTGSSNENFIIKSTLAVQSYGKSLYEACSLNEQIKEVMAELNLLDEVTLCNLNSDYNYTDMTKHRYRYQAVYEITHY